MSQETYQTRLDRIKKAVKREELPDRVPALFQYFGWIIEYYGYSLADYYRDDPAIAPECYRKGMEEFGFDGAFNLNNVSSYKSTEAMGGGMYAVTERGIQVSNIATAEVMSENEYPLLTKDFIGYLRDYTMPRRFSKLAGGNTDEALQALKTAQTEKLKFLSVVAPGWGQIEKAGCPIMWHAGVLTHPVDFLLDYLRDFKGITLDLRRRPQEVLDAMAVIQDYLMKNVYPAFKADPDCKGPFWPTHLACFLNRKQFEKFYFPYFNETLTYCIDRKIYSGLILEGNWEAYFDTMQDIPDNNYLVSTMEFGDFKNFKARMGKKFTVCGGLPVSTLALASREDCVDQVKKILDDCAPGGGFILSADKALLNAGDAKGENMKAVMETLELYGKY
ncbi:MAG: hypothetical protein IJT62_06690 [Oscillospiraceae bacterium]|nr:hypothetical protein [Oscillospiraceae bacterium]